MMPLLPPRAAAAVTAGVAFCPLPHRLLPELLLLLLLLLLLHGGQC
jgi:hypothetical protein